MAMEVTTSNSICYKCGTAFSRKKGFFPVSYAILYKGRGYIHICKDCIDSLYNGYLAQCNNAKDAVRQVCRKLDLYWNESIYQMVEKKNTTRTMMTDYIMKINSVKYAGKSYDDTLLSEGTLWNFRPESHDIENHTETDAPDTNETKEESYTVGDDVVAFWGTGYTPAMYTELEQRRTYWMSKFPDDFVMDVGTEAIIRQICSLELDINRDRAAGRSVDKSVNALNSLLGSASLKPTQKKSDDADAAIDGTPLGVWIRRWENQRPIPEVDPELQDVDGVVRYISIWFLGHLCKMLGIKNTYCKLYEDELAKLRIERPEYEDEGDEEMFNDIFGTGDMDGDE